MSSLLFQTAQLPFSFPFYGHRISNVTIATGGKYLFFHFNIRLMDVKSSLSSFPSPCTSSYFLFLCLLLPAFSFFVFVFFVFFSLAHLSTTCSRGAFRVTGCLSSVVHRQQFFKHQLLLNCWANLDQTWQECSLGGPL